MIIFYVGFFESFGVLYRFFKYFINSYVVDLIFCFFIWRGLGVFMDVFVGEYGRYDGYVVGYIEFYEFFIIIRFVVF